MKNTKKDNGMKASSLKNALISLFFILTIGSAVGFYFINNTLVEFSDDIKKNSPTIASNDSAMKATEALKEFISKNKIISDKASSLIMNSSDSQNKVMTDLKKYANDTGISITDFSFNTTSVPNIGGSSSYSTKLVTITLGSPVTYTSFIKFLELVEGNSPFMQPTGVSISSVDNSKVKVEPITIKFYTK